MKPLVRNAALNSYAELGRSLGTDPRGLMKQVGLDPVGLAFHDRWISGVAATRLLELPAASHREDFGLLLAERRRLSNLGPISLVVREEPDARSAVELRVCYEHMYNEMLHSRLSEASGLATLKVALEPGEAMPARQATELAAGGSTKSSAVSSALGGSRCPCASHTAHQRIHRHIGALSVPQRNSTRNATGLSSTPVTPTLPTPCRTRCSTPTRGSISAPSRSRGIRPYRTGCAS